MLQSERIQKSIATVALIGCLSLLVRVNYAEREKIANTPFTLAWTDGVCKRCKSARQLGQILFTRPNEAWAVGFHLPSKVENGSGDYIIVHTADSGRTWTELSSTATHAVEPALFFVDALHGWVSGMSPMGDSWVLQTDDGGVRWKQTSNKCLQMLEFFDRSHGYGKEVNHFLRTADGGHTWTQVELLQVRFIDRMLFLNSQIGWVAGSNGEDAVILRTSDGGKYWEESRIHTSTRIGEVRDLFFLNAKEGWLITWHLDDEGTHLFRTEDGGKTWNIDPDSSFQGERKWLSGVRFVGDNVALAFGRESRGGAEDQGVLLYSTDRGSHWQKFDLKRWLYDCQAMNGDLLCTALSADSTFSLLKIHPQAAMRTREK